MIRRILRYGWGAAAAGRANVGRPAAPMKLTFALTYWCQYRCTTCNIWQRKPEDELTTDEILAFVRQARGIVWADLTGGEIFLRPDVTDVLGAMVASWRRLAVLHFPTNGFLTERIVNATQRLARRGGPAIVITVSVDGPRRLNDEIRGLDGGFDRQMDTLRALRRIPGVRAAVGMTLSRANVDAVRATFDACASAVPGLGEADFHVNVMQLSAHYYGNGDLRGRLPPAAAAREAIRQQRRRRRLPLTPSAWLESRYLRHLEEFLATGRTPLACHALRSSCFIDPWGTVFPCLTYSRPVGSLRDTGMNLDPIWRSQEVRERQAEIWRGQCPQCWTACDAYPTILGNALRPGGGRPGGSRG